MKRSTRLFLQAILAISVLPCISGAQNPAGRLLLPFPAEAEADTPPAGSDGAVPERPALPGPARKNEDLQRAAELAETFLERQRAEIASSVPRRGESSINIPTRTSIGRRTSFAKGTGELPDSDFDQGQGPVTELLPMPGELEQGLPLDDSLPDTMLPPPGGETTPAVPGEHEVPRSDLAPAPAFGTVENQTRTGPVFRVSGTDAVAVARARGFKFTPAGGIGPLDGNHTAASQFPNMLTSEVHGTRMSQLRPPPNWSVTETSNTFFMFCDSGYNAVRLSAGWRIRGIRLAGANWRWVACPRSGANTASFSVRVYSFQGQESSTTVQLAGLTLEGPDGASDWREAFPWLNGKGPAPDANSIAQQPSGPKKGKPSPVEPRVAGASSGTPAEPPLPE